MARRGPLLERAVDTKIEEQEEFVGWWDGVVSVRLSNRKANRDRRSLSKDDAEKTTGISQQQVSRWRRCLADREKYRALTRKRDGDRPCGACCFRPIAFYRG